MTARAAISEKHSNRGALALVVLWTVICMIWWGLAFWPVSSTTPEWFARTQYVCFGSKPSGLPDTYGWFLLFAGPGLLLASMLVSHFSEIRSGLLGGFAKPKTRVFLFLIFGGFALESGWVVLRIQEGFKLENTDYSPTSKGALPANYPRTSKPAPKFDFVDQFGKAVSTESLKGKVVIFTFAFSHCETVCPMLVQNTLEALKKLDKDKTAGVFLTLDPWRDTPSSLPGLAENWGLPENGHVLSGKVEAVTKALSEFDVPWQRNEKTGEVTHPALVYVIDTEGRIAYAFNNPPVDWLVDAARGILKQ